MSRSVFILLIVVAMVATVWGYKNHIQKCGKNEEWKTCGSMCPPTCNQLQPACADTCIKSCQCKIGYVRNNRNECVRPCECDC